MTKTLRDDSTATAHPTAASRQPAGLNRRAMLERTAVGGAAVAATLLGPAGLGVARGQDGDPQRPITTGRVRRVVTGHNAEGRSYLVSDEMVDVNDLWSTTAEQPLGKGPAGEQHPHGRATGDSRCFIATLGPSPDPMPTRDNRIGFHVTPGIAYCYILTGEIVFLVDDAEVRLTAGDLVVERGTDHSWRNEGSVPVGMFITVVTAEA